MSKVFAIKKGATTPSIKGIVRNKKGEVIPVTGATVKFRMREYANPPSAGTLKVADKAGVILDGPGGQIAYNWVAADTDTEALYNGLFVITFPDNSIAIVPSEGYTLVNVEDAL